MHFLLWTKGSHESTNFDTFKCSDENLLNSPCHFPNQKSGLLQILHDSLVPRKITPLYFLKPNVTYFARKGPIKVQILEIFECSDQRSSHSCHFWNNKLVLLQILHHFSVSWDITPLYFFSWSFIYILSTKGAYQSTNLVKFHLSSRKSEILHFDGLLL